MLAKTEGVAEQLRDCLDYPHHLRELLEESRIDPQVVLDRGYRTEKTKAELERLGFSKEQQRTPALLIPMYSPTGERTTCQIKPDVPRKDKDGKPIKYETPSGSEIRLDVHPSQVERIKDPSVPLFVTEGIKKGDCLVSHSQCAVVLQGVWCWKRDGIPLRDWEDIKLYGRLVYVVFDSDVITKSSIQDALEGLVAFLKSQGAKVKVIYLPDGEGSEKQGVDDYLVSGGTIEELLGIAEDGLREDLTTITTITAVSGELPEPVDFPVEALPRSARRLVEEAAASIGCPRDLVAVPMLVALGTAIGNSRVIKLKEGWNESAAIYAAVVADPGEKKTPAMGEAVRPVIKEQAALREAYREKQDEYKRECREYEVDKKDARENKLAAPPPPKAPVMERTVVEDTTVEALAVVLEGTLRGVLAMRDELAGWVRSMDQYKAGGKGADRQFWLSAWSNRTAVVDRKSRSEPLMLSRPFVGVFGSIQPKVLPELSGGREDGLLDRFLFAYPEPVPSRWTDDEISAEARAAYKELYDGLRGLHMPEDEHGDPNPVRIMLAPDAKEVLVAAINQHREEMETPGFPARLKGPWAKLEAYLARLSLILALARSVDNEAPERVETRDVLCAMVLLDYFKSQARRVYVGLYGEDPNDRLAEDVAKFLKEQGGSWEGQASELHKQLKSNYKPPREDELSKKLKAIAERTPGLFFETGERWVKEVNNKRRFVKLLLKNGGNGGNGGKGGAS